MGVTKPQAHVLAHLDDVRGVMVMYGHRNFVKWKLDGKDVSSIVNALQRKGLVVFPRGLVGTRRLEHHPNAMLNLLEGYGSGRERTGKA